MVAPRGGTLNSGCDGKPTSSLPCLSVQDLKGGSESVWSWALRDLNLRPYACEAYALDQLS